MNYAHSEPGCLAGAVEKLGLCAARSQVVCDPLDYLELLAVRQCVAGSSPAGGALLCDFANLD